MVLEVLKIEVPDPMVICCDNPRVIALSKNPTVHIKSKHFTLNYHFVWKRMMVKSLTVPFCIVSDQIADLLSINQGVAENNFSTIVLSIVKLVTIVIR